CTKLWEDQQAGNIPNIWRTAAYYGVPRSTLREASCTDSNTLDGHSQLKDDPRFAGLYSRVTRGQKRMHKTCTMDENTAPADSLERSAVRRRRLD
ncbi:hypothetical protein M405DRAFT_805695, partial [Rhizopogon salebrosus TDB-379]